MTASPPLKFRGVGFIRGLRENSTTSAAGRPSSIGEALKVFSEHAAGHKRGRTAGHKRDRAAHKKAANAQNSNDAPEEDMLGDGDGGDIDAGLGAGAGAGFWRRRRASVRRRRRRRREGGIRGTFD